MRHIEESRTKSSTVYITLSLERDRTLQLLPFAEPMVALSHPTMMVVLMPALGRAYAVLVAQHAFNHRSRTYDNVIGSFPRRSYFDLQTVVFVHGLFGHWKG